MLFAAGLSWKIQAAGLLAAVVATPFVWQYALKPYMRNRILFAFNPDELFYFQDLPADERGFDAGTGRPGPQAGGFRTSQRTRRTDAASRLRLSRREFRLNEVRAGRDTQAHFPFSPDKAR